MTEFRVCPACGYGRGFHLSLKGAEEGFGIVLICPSCGASYDPGWVVQAAGAENPEPGPVFPSKEGAGQ